MVNNSRYDVGAKNAIINVCVMIQVIVIWDMPMKKLMYKLRSVYGPN